jgi:TRAP-type C4-dicarboxylate transport system substrate-binding protein
MRSGDQEIVREVFGRANTTLDGTSRSDNEEARQALVKQGVELVHPSDETHSKWEEIAAAATERLVEQQGYDPSIMAMIDELLSSYRARDTSGKTGN